MDKTIRSLITSLTKAAAWALAVAVLISGCVNRAASETMLEKRADYEGAATQEAEELKLSSGPALDVVGVRPARTAPKIAHIWIFPHETSSKEYFWGGWISVVVEGDKWNVDKPLGLLPERPALAAPQPAQPEAINPNSAREEQ